MSHFSSNLAPTGEKWKYAAKLFRCCNDNFPLCILNLSDMKIWSYHWRMIFSESNQQVAASQSVDKTSPSCQPCHYGTNKCLQISHIEQ